MSDTTPRLTGNNPSALPPGTRLGEFELLSVLGVGGFGIVYLAFDHALEREVAVKEYMPASLAGRTETLHVSLRSQSDADTFELGRKSFVNEAKLLARFDHPSLLKVHRFWEANGTAYMAMPVMRGRTVKEVRLEMGAAPDEAWLRAMLGPLLGAIEKLHSEGVYHRDIAPDNIQIEPDGHPVLLDFGAARRVISDKTQTLTAILKPAYAPIEQYAEAGSVKQGPWTDLYALGATLHYLLLNRAPPPATTRAFHDEASALTTAACPGCSENFLHTIDWMLAPRPADRPQSVAALREVLDGHAHPPRRRADMPEAPSQWDRTVILNPSTVPPRTLPPADDDTTRVLPPAVPRTAPQVVTASTQAQALAPAAAPVAAPAPVPPPPAAAQPLPEFSAPPVATALSAAPAASGASKALPLMLGAGVVLAAVAAFAFWPKTAPAPAVVATAPVATPAAPEPAPPPASSSVPESAITTVVVAGMPAAKPAAANPPSSIGTRTGTSVGTNTNADGALPPTKPAAANDKPAARPPAANARTGNATTPATTAHLPAAPPAAVPAQMTSQPEPVRPPAEPQTAAPTAVATEPVKPAAAGPEGKCGARSGVRYFICMERECLRSEFSSHADCLKWRKEAKRENN